MQQQSETIHYAGHDCRVFAYRERIGGHGYVTTFVLNHPTLSRCCFTEADFRAISERVHEPTL